MNVRDTSDTSTRDLPERLFGFYDIFYFQFLCSLVSNFYSFSHMVLDLRKWAVRSKMSDLCLSFGASLSVFVSDQWINLSISTSMVASVRKCFTEDICLDGLEQEISIFSKMRPCFARYVKPPCLAFPHPHICRSVLLKYISSTTIQMFNTYKMYDTKRIHWLAQISEPHIHQTTNWWACMFLVSQKKSKGQWYK